MTPAFEKSPNKQNVRVPCFCLQKHARVIYLIGLIFLCGCSRGQNQKPDGPAPRIISNSAAITQILFDMGLGDHVVGVTNWCDLPAGTKYANIPRVADAHGIRAEAAMALQPDLILTQSDPRMFAVVRRARPNVKIEHVRLESLNDIMTVIRQIGQLTDRQDLADKQIAAMQNKLKVLSGWGEKPRRKPRVLFFSGAEHPLVAGPGTYIGDLIVRAGGVNAAADVPGKQLWRKAKVESIIAAEPDVLIVKVAPGREKQTREFWLSRKDMPAARAGRVHIVTDDTWLRPSARVADLAGEIRKMIPREKR
jgi:iron complex transport system substrate-binding protein